jgi:N-glycosylase/DNA lyase
VTLAILYSFSVRYVRKLDSCAHILQAFSLALKPGVTPLVVDSLLWYTPAEAAKHSRLRIAIEILGNVLG